MSGMASQRTGAPEPVVLDGGAVTPAQLECVARGGARVLLAPEALRLLSVSRAVVEEAIARGDTVYGINTGFGNLSRMRISSSELATLQRNLVLSHAAGVGDPLPDEVVRAMLLLLAASLCRGYSGVRPRLVQQVVEILNRGVCPIVPSRGSLGASGDLAPLAHLALVLIGEGEATVAGTVLPGGEALRRVGLEPLEMATKEGLALLNGTHLMAAIGALAVQDAAVLVESAEVAAAMSLEALRGSDVPFDARIHAVRRQRGQVETAAHMRALLAGSMIIPSHRKDDVRVQDPYTLRCVPQVIGAVRDTLRHCRETVECELAAVTDNPLCFPQEKAILSGGNFHGQPLALALDILGIALAELGAFSERRIVQLLDDRQPEPFKLPPFLAREPGLNSGCMIAQYVAAALVAENAVLATPAGIHSLSSSAGMEDFVSMGATAALKARTIGDNSARIVAIELLCAAEGLDHRRPLRAGESVETAYERVRERVAPLVADRALQPDILALAGEIRRGSFVL